MRSINWFYIAIAAVGIFLFIAFQKNFHEELSFYGFAESRATEINYNYPVVVEEILVKPGQAVQSGQVLMHLSRRKSRETLEDQGFRIAQLQAEEALWKKRKENEISRLESDHRLETSEIEGRILELEKEIEYKKSLSEGLKSIKMKDASYKPLEEELQRYRMKKLELTKSMSQKKQDLAQEILLGKSPYRTQIERYIAEKEFDDSQKVLPIVMTAPIDGLVGTISCKEAEHIDSYTTLLTFYEPHSGLIKGFVHEDLTLEVEIGQEFKVRSLKDEMTAYEGLVIGLGSRIVEIPPRLRKVETIKAYGREVLIEIPKENAFLQKEKVSITYKPEL